MIRRLKRYLPLLVILLFFLVLAIILGGRYISNEYQTYHSDSVRQYETAVEEHGAWVLTTERKELLGKVYATFTISIKDSGDLVYRCPDLYLVSDLVSIRWEENSDDVLVESSHQGLVRYRQIKKGWEKAE